MLLEKQKTVIGTKTATINGEKTKINILYGNFVQKPDGEIAGSVSDKVYQDMLKIFLTEHPDYSIPQENADIPDTIDENKIVPANHNDKGELVDNSGEVLKVEYAEPIPTKEELEAKKRAEEEKKEQELLAQKKAQAQAEEEKLKQQQLAVEKLEQEAKLKKAVIKEEKQAEPKKIKQQKEKKSKHLLPIILSGVIVVLIVLFGLVYLGIIKLPNSNIATQNPTHNDQTKYSITRVNKDLKQGDVINAEDLEQITISGVEYNNVNTTVYIQSDGSQVKGTLLTWDNHEDAVGKFVTHDMTKGMYLNIPDYSSQKIVSEKTFIEVEVEGETIQVPVDTVLKGTTKCKIVVLIDSDTQEGTIAVALGEFVLQDRSLQDIFDSAGQSVLEQLAQQQLNK